MNLQKMTNNSLDGSTSRIRVPQRTGSLKSSGKDKPPFYRPNITRNSVDSFCLHPSASPASNSESNINTQEIGAVQQPEQYETFNEQPASITEELDKSCEETTRGIPNNEIVGSSLKKPLRAGSKKESTKKVSKLPKISVKAIQEPKSEHINCKEEQQKTEINDSMFGNNISENVVLNTQSRRNSLERPSYFNALCKNSLHGLSNGATRSLSLSVGHSQNGDLSSDSSASAINEDSNRYRKYTPSRFDSRESSVSESDYLTIRPYSSLNRTFSLKNSPVSSYSTLRKSPQRATPVGDIEARFNSSSVSNISRSSSTKSGDRFLSRFLRPKSFYEGSDLSNYQSSSLKPSSHIANAGLENGEFYPGKLNLTVRRKSPSYQRSISLFDGSKSTSSGNSLRITPDRSVLQKFLPDKKDMGEERNVLTKSDSVDKSKTRRVSRFLRPDFYDTPKEDSVYENKLQNKNEPKSEIWEEKPKISKSSQNKPYKNSKNDVKSETSRVSIIDKAIRSLKEKSSSKTDRESMERESNLIKRAVSLEDCSIVPEIRNRRSTSVTPQSSYGEKVGIKKTKEHFQQKNYEDFKKIVDNKLNAQTNVRTLDKVPKQESVIKKLVRKLSPKGNSKNKSIKGEEKQICSGGPMDVMESNHNVKEESGLSTQDRNGRLNRIAGLKRLEFGRQIPSADSTPSMEESKLSTELDDSSSFLSPTEDGSDTWSISSDYADAREFNFSLTNPEDSVSDRIRRKSFYSRFNQSKKKKSSQSSQLSGSRSRLPTYSRSISSDFNNMTQSKQS